MRSNESKALEAIARMYEAAPKYLLGAKGKDELERALIEAIDALDIVEYGRTKKTFLGSIQNEVPYRRKRTILSLVEERHLTPREGHVLRYLANGHNPSYIADKLGISLTTARTHTYSIYRKLGVHSKAELEIALRGYHADESFCAKSSDDGKSE